jgi:hypothetical protein
LCSQKLKGIPQITKVEEFNIERDEKEILMEFVGPNVYKALEIARK